MKKIVVVEEDLSVVDNIHLFGKNISQIEIVKSFDCLTELHNSCIALGFDDANYRINLVKQLHKQHNKFLFFYTSEVTGNIEQLVNDFPEAKKQLWVLGGTNSNLKSFNSNHFYSVVASDKLNQILQSCTLEEIFEQKNKSFKFLYLNGRMKTRKHRINLFNKISSRGLLDYALYSVLEKVPDQPHIEVKLLEDKYENCFFTDLQKESASVYSMMNNVYHRLILPQYKDTYFAVITESTVDYDFITEKTYKILAAGMPFIILGHKGLYARLHDMGFKTFHPLIDESFDQESDLENKCIQIVDQIEKLCQTELDQFLLQVKDICVYNQQHFFGNYQKHLNNTHKNFMNFLESNLSS